MAESTKNVFVSYSWGTEEETGILDELERQCKLRNIQLIRDRDTVEHGDSIRKFMERMTGGEHIITIFSKDYFESKWCMFELLTTFQRGDFAKRTHPIIADDCNLQDQNYRLKLVSYWERKQKEAEIKLKGFDPSVVTDEYKHVNLYRDIYQNINQLVNFAAGRLTTPLNQLRKKNYAQILDKISQSTSEKTFLDKIEKNIAEGLAALKDSIYVKILWEELNLVLVKLRLEQIDQDPNQMAKGLISALEQGGRDCPVITLGISKSVLRCLDPSEDPKSYEQSQDGRKKITQTVEKIIGYLVLTLVNPMDARNLQQWLGKDDFSGLYFELHVRTLGGVELFMSYQQQRKADLQLDSAGKDIIGKYLIFVDTTPFQWSEKAKLQDTQLIVWNVINDEERTTPLNEDEIQKLDADLSTAKIRPRDPANYCVVMGFEDNGNKSYADQCTVFLKDLTIPLVRYKVDGGSAPFFGFEPGLMSAVKQFLKYFNECKYK